MIGFGDRDRGHSCTSIRDHILIRAFCLENDVVGYGQYGYPERGIPVLASVVQHVLETFPENGINQEGY